MSEARVNGRFVWVGVLTIALTLFYGSLAIIYAFLRLPRQWLDGCSRNWARGILRAAKIQVELQGLEHLSDKPAVLVGNHQGMLDILVLLGHLPKPPVFVAKHTLFWIPIFGQAMRAVGHIPVNRSNREKAIASIERGTRKLQQHRDQVVFFPEGTRTRNGEILPFKKGAFVFALQSQLPLVPFAIEGSFRALPPGKRCLHSGVIRVRFLTPIQMAEWDLETRDALMQMTHHQIAQALKNLNETEADYQRLGRCG